MKDNKKNIQSVSVLSLFDGMACGMLAMQGAGVEVDNYYAYEIDKYAIKTTQHNFPNIKELGDVFEADFTQYKDIDYLVGGSPCTFWSIAQSPDKRETTASGLGWDLFSQYVRALHEAQPKYFIYENNKSMSKAIYNSISETFGFEPIMINAALVSAQNRQRYYWVGKRNEDGTYSKVDVKQPEDRGILLQDILDNALDLTSKDKAWALTASYDGAVAWNTIERKQRNMAIEPVNYTLDGKSQCIRATCYKDGIRNMIGNNVDRKTCVAEAVNITPDGKSQTIKAQYQNTSIANVCKYTSTYGATGVAEEVIIKSSKQVGAMPRPNGELSTSQAFRVYDANAKSVTLKAGGGGAGGKTGLYAIPVEFENNIPTKAVSSTDSKTYTVYPVSDGIIVIKGKKYPIKLCDGYYIIRKLSVNECKRLQTIPEWYEFPVSNAQAYKMIGNGWCVEVIIHLIKSILKE